MNKLTDAEIVKAFECCKSFDDLRACYKCPALETDGCASGKTYISDFIIKEMLDIIKRKDEEIERYKRVVGKLTIGEDGETAILLDDHETEYIKKDLHKVFMNMARKQAKAEAIKELREKCNEHQDFHKGDDGVFRAYISIEDLDRVIDEM